MEDSGHAVVKQAEDKEDVVKTSKNYQEVIERVLHVLRGENEDGEGVTKESKDGDRNLLKILDMCFYCSLLTSSTPSIQ